MEEEKENEIKVYFWTMDILRLMNDNPKAEYTIEEIASLFNITKRLAYKRFRKLVKWKTVKAYKRGEIKVFVLTEWGAKYLRDMGGEYGNRDVGEGVE